MATQDSQVFDLVTRKQSNDLFAHRNLLHRSSCRRAVLREALRLPSGACASVRSGPGSHDPLGGRVPRAVRAIQPTTVPPAKGVGPEYPGWRHTAFLVEDLDCKLDCKLAEMGQDVRITLGPLDMGKMITGMRVAWVATRGEHRGAYQEAYAELGGAPVATPLTCTDAVYDLVLKEFCISLQGYVDEPYPPRLGRLDNVS